MSGNQVNPEQGMLDLNQRMRESKSRALPLGECPIYCHMKAMASIWPNIIAMLMSLVIAVSFSFNVALVIPNAINASHTVVAIFSTNMIYTSFSLNTDSVMHARAKNTIETTIEYRSEKSIP